GLYRIGFDPALGVVDRLDEGDRDLRIFFGKVLAHHHAVEIRHAGFAAVVDHAAGAAELHDLRPRAEVGVGVDFLGGDVGGADGRALVLEFDGRKRDFGVAESLDQHAPGRAADRGGHRAPTQILDRLDVRADGNDDGVAGALLVVGRAADQHGAQAGGLLEFGAVDDQRVIAHHAKIQLVGQHLVGDRG